MVLGKRSILVIGLSAVVLVAITLLATVPAVNNPELAGTGGSAKFMADLATNPELRLFRRHAAQVAKQAAAQFLARNPEVRVRAILGR